MGSIASYSVKRFLCWDKNWKIFKIYPWGGRLIFGKYSKMLLYCISEMEFDELFLLSQGLARE